jgi:DNA-binding transcriptional MerR regulator
MDEIRSSKTTTVISVETEFTTKDVAALLGVSPRRLRGFVKAELVVPNRGPRGRYIFNFRDLVLLRTIHSLTETLSTRRVGRLFRRLREELPDGDSITSVRIKLEGRDVVVRDDDGGWNPESGQLLLDLDEEQLPLPLPQTTQLNPVWHISSLGLKTADQWFRQAFDLESQDPEGAKRAYVLALELDPNHTDAHLNLGRLYHAACDLGPAEHHYRQAMACDPGQPTPAFNLGVVLEDQRRGEEALCAYERAIAANPRYHDAHHNLARLAEQLGRPQLAMRHLRILRQLSRNG